MKTVRRLITAEIIGFVLGVFDRYYPGVGIAIGWSYSATAAVVRSRISLPR